MDNVVGEVQSDFIQWKIGVLDLLGEHDVAVAVIARKRSGSVGTHGELPDLKFLGGDSLVVGLNDRDFVQKPRKCCRPRCGRDGAVFVVGSFF